jgi:L-fucose isomerase
MCAPGEITLARLARKNGKYWMAITTGEFITVKPEKLNEISPEWPQGFAKLSGDSQELISSLDSCHLHAIYGNYVNELIEICNLKGIDYKLFSKQ